MAPALDRQTWKAHSCCPRWKVLRLWDTWFWRPCFTQWLISLMVFRKGPSCELLVIVTFNLIFPYRTSLIIFLRIKHIKTRGLHLDEWRPCINIFFQVGLEHSCCPLLAVGDIGHTLDLFFIHFIWNFDSSESEKENVSHIYLIISLANHVPI